MNLRKLTTGVFCTLAIWVILYLMGSFVATSFDIQEWQVMGRGFIALMASFGAVMVFVLGVAS